MRPLPIVPADKKPKEGRGVMGTVAGTTAELPSLTPSATSGGVPGTIPPPSLDNDKQLSDNIELKKACPSVSAVKAKPSVPTPFKKNTPEKPVPQSRPTKPVSSAPPGAPVAPVIKNGEMPIPPLRHNGELPPGGVANGALVGGRNGDPDVEGHDETQEGVGESEYSLLSDVLGESSDFSKFVAWLEYVWSWLFLSLPYTLLPVLFKRQVSISRDSPVVLVTTFFFATVAKLLDC